MSTPPKRPVLNRRAAQIRERLLSRVQEFRAWDDGYTSTLHFAALTIDEYLRRAQSAAENPDDQTALAAAGEAHREARAYLSEFLVIDAGRVHLAPLDSDGLDSDITRLCRGIE